MKLKKGFTLIELLVVIAIIGVLATISVLALANARAKSRDAKRAGDIKQVQTSLELFFNDKGRYPTSDEWATGRIYSTSTDATSTYMQIIPTAPTPSDGACTNSQNSVVYMQDCSGTSYAISFCLGNNTGTLAPGPKCLTPGGILDKPCFVCGQDFFDCRNNQTYPTVKIGNDCWFKKNLNVGSMVSSKLADNTTLRDQANNGTIEKYCYGYIQDGDAGQQATGATNCDLYGGLYQWNEAMQYSAKTQGICPQGWHIPSVANLSALDSLGASKLKASSTSTPIAWDGTNTSGFTAIPTGNRNISGAFSAQGSSAYFWSSLLNPNGNISIRYIYSTYYDSGGINPAFGLSVRCVLD